MLTILKQLLEIIEYLHDNGVCHRDLKPDNILINSKTKMIKLTDFNISKRFREDGEARMLRTPTGLDQWSAPETRKGGEYTQSVDYWGIGVILYFLITFSPPFSDQNELKLL